jgi:hypothetical protein
MENAEKIPYELQISGMEDGEMLKRFPTNSEDCLLKVPKAPNPQTPFFGY